ncbi:hypothetical protein KKH39_02365 [Patescibacteria group bacterium]|nr:hypothetical protein [Patescibacteria group bacterium]
MRYIKKLDFICKTSGSLLFVVVIGLAGPVWAASTDYYMKIDDIQGESKEAEESGPPISGIDINGEDDLDSDGRAETRITGVEPDEIDYDSSQETNFGVLLDSGNSGEDSNETKDSGQDTTVRVQEEGVANTGIEPDEIDVAIDNETSAAVDVFIKIPPIDGESDEKMVGLDGLYIDYRDDDSDDDNLEADHEAEITLKGQAGEARTSVQYPYKLGTHIRVDAKLVRAWDQETKEAVRSRLASRDAKNDTADIGLFVALQALDNEAITDINIEDDTTVVSYTTKLSVFGFIPVEIKAEARVAKDGEVKVKYPWWHFLARKSSDDTYRNIATEISARIAIEEEGIPAVDEKN